MRLFLSIVLTVFTCSLSAQQLFVSRDIQQAYKNQTRSADGMPGKNYWQNKANYKINITAMPPASRIDGVETIQYFNNSPDTLRSLAIKLFLNVHKPGAAREFDAAPDYLSTGIIIDETTVNGKKIDWGNNGFTTVEELELPGPLLPKAQIQLGFKWHYDISKQSGREGMIDSTSFFFAYFYPRVAVYDDYNGWDYIPFTDSREFYSDFNDYDVTLKVPKDYVVWGTGTLQQPEKVLQPQILQRYQQSLQTEETIHIATKDDNDNKRVTAQNETNEWHFACSNVPDVAFGTSNHYLWDGSSAIVDSKTGRRASAQAAYQNESQDYRHVARYAKHSLSWFSNNWPGIAYPYEKTTIFQGFADMEYPMMANNSSFPDTNYSRFVAEHEIAHTYMPFYMGINETRYGFMDEGWATAFEYFIGQEDLGKEKADAFFKRFRVNGWAKSKSPSQAIPIIVPADALTIKGFGNNIYGKPALAYLAMHDLLGDELFKKCLQGYMARWNGKHPMPWDFFYSFNSISGKNLNWFWNKWFMEPSYIDLALKSAKAAGKKYELEIENIGGMATPVDAVLQYKDGSRETVHFTPAIWEKNQETATVTVSAAKDVESIVLDGGIFVDGDTSNNKWASK